MGFLKRHLAALVLTTVALAWFAFFQCCYSYHFFYQEQNQLFLWSWQYVATYFESAGGMSRLLGDFLTQFYYYLYAGAVILCLCLLLLGTLLQSALHRLGLPRYASLAAAVLAMSFVAVCHFAVSYRLSATVAFIAWTTLLWLATLLRRRWWQLAAVAVGAIPVWLLFGWPQVKHVGAPEYVLEQDFAVDNEYHFGNYDRVVSMVEGAEVRTQEMLFFYNLVQAQRGMLPDCLLKFAPNNLGTFYRIGPETPRIIINNMNELYWALGDMTFTERAAMMTNVFAPENRNVRMVQRLAECSLVSGDSLAAEKYLRLLGKTLAYRQWADRARNNKLYAEKATMANRRDTVTVGDNAHFLMMQLLDANPGNTVALDYILCSTLLLKDLTNFKRDYDRYCMDRQQPRLKRLYQEALCIYLAGTNAPQEEWQKYIAQQDVMRRFVEYNSQRGNPAFRDTYWYYFDKAKTPEI